MSAIIPINDQYRIEIDESSWQVSKWRTRTKHPDGGNWEGISWHRTLQQAGESLVQLTVSQDDLECVPDVIEALHASSRTIARAIVQSPYHDSWLDEQNSYSSEG